MRRPRLFAGSTAVVMMVSGVVSVGSVAAVPARAAVAPAVDGVLVRPDRPSAALTARVAGRRVEISGDRTESTTTYANPDGTFTTDMASAPVRVRQGDGWADVDPTLQSTSQGWSAKATLGSARFSAGGASAPAAQLTTTAGAVGLRWPSALPAPSVSGATATYPNVAPNVDLKLTSTPTGLGLAFVLRQRPTSAPTLRIPLALTGLTVSQSADSRLHFLDRTGDEVLTSSGALMFGAQRGTGSDEPTRVGAVTAKLVDTADGPELDITPDALFLADPTVSYPVTIDPSTSLAEHDYTYFSSAYPSTSYYDNTITDQGVTGITKVGTYNSGTDKNRAGYSFHTSAILGKDIVSATLSAQEIWSYSCTARAVDLWDSAGYASSTTWNTQPAVYSKWATVTVAKGYSSSCPAGAVTFDTKAMVQKWAGMSYTIDYAQLRSPNETDNTYWKKFDGNHASISVTYNSYPNTPSGTTTSPAVVCTTGSNRPYVNTLRPVLKATVSDPDGGQLKGSFALYHTGGAQIGGEGLSGWVNSGAQAGWTLPSSTLVEGSPYSWKARGYDGTDYSKSYTGWCEFNVDLTAPSAPTVSSAQFPAGVWSASGSGTFTFAATDPAPPSGTPAGVSYYRYDLDKPYPSTVTTAGSVTLSPPDGAHRLYVQAVDKAGNASAVTGYPFNVGAGAITSPITGDTSSTATSTGGQFKVTAAVATTSPSVRYQWRRADADGWADIAVGDLTFVDGGGHPASSDIPATNGLPPALWWDAASTAGLDGPLQLRAVVAAGATDPVRVRLDRDHADGASTGVGPGSLNLLTGNYTLAVTDASVDSFGSDLTVARTYTSRTPAAGADGIFGPGWVSSTAIDATGTDYTGLTVSGSLVTLSGPDGDDVSFTRNPDGSFTPQVGAEDLTLTASGAPVTAYLLKDLDGNTTTFSQPTGTSGPWVVTAASTAGTAAPTTSVSWQTVGGVTRPTRILAPVPAGVSCPAYPDALPRGCRALTFRYATSGTPGDTPQTWGDYPGRLVAVDFTGWDPDLPTPAMSTYPVAGYAYDSTGRLRAAWDPRISPALKTSYGYDTDGHVLTLTPPGQDGWTFGYTSTSGDANTGRLATLTRSAGTAGTAVSAVVYDVPISGTGAPYDLSGGQAGRWGQTDLPTDATAVVPPVTSGQASTDLTKASVYYLDGNARQVNVAAPGGRISTSEYDQFGNTVRTLSAGNRDRALTASDADTAQQEAEIAHRLDSQNVYSADGQDLLETYGPEHDTVVDGSSQRARAHTVNTYDEGSPGGEHYGLVTTSVSGARVAGAGSDTDTRTTTTSYDWTLRQPTAVTADPAGLALSTRTSYDTVTGLVTSTTLPGSSTPGSTAQTTTTSYYTAAANTSYPACGDHPEWANLACRVGPAAQPATDTDHPPIPATYTTYSVWNAPRVVTETDETTSTVVRTTTTGYDAAGRPTTVTVTATTTPASVAVPTTRTVYDDATGMAVRTQSLDGSGVVTAEVIRHYDSGGRLDSYTDADQNLATTGYDLQGRPQTSSDGKAAQTRSYDPTTGQLTQLVDDQAGTFTAGYDADGNLVSEIYPGGLTATTSYDETGSATALSYTLPDGTEIAGDLVAENIRGQQVTHDGLPSDQTYGYDAAGRLTSVTDTVGDTCTARAYFFAGTAGKDTNRTGEASATGTPAGGCPTVPTTASTTHSYDTASRTTDTGYRYDALGRTTTLPAAATLTGTSVSPTYYATDLVATLGTSSYGLDPTGTRNRTVTSAGGTSTQHYDDDTDTPAWTTKPGTSTGEYTRTISGPGGDLAAVRGADGSISIELANLHGDIAATTTTTPATDGLTGTVDATEFGAPRATVDIGTRRYGWLGAKTRPADNPAGVVLMGVRLYNPATGRFLQTDPAPGGSANDYDYCSQDPINKYDLDGRWWHFRSTWRRTWSVARFARNAPATAAGYGWARIHHGRCRFASGLILACGGMRGGYSRGGTTIGNAWLYGNLGGRARLRHETKHGDQWAIFGLSFPLLYGAESFRTRHNVRRNIFERWAGLRDGGY